MNEIQELKYSLPLPRLMDVLGLPHNVNPFRKDKNLSYHFHETPDGWLWSDYGTGKGGDEITFLEELYKISVKEAIDKMKELVGGYDETQFEPMDMGDSNTKLVGSKLVNTEAAKFDWDACVQAFDKHSYLIEVRGYSPEFVERMLTSKMIGCYEGGIAFPVYDVRGDYSKVVGCHFKSGNIWMFAPKGIRNSLLCIGDPTVAEQILLFESQWDMFAVADKAHVTNSSFVCTRGASNGRLIEGVFNENAKVISFPQNDELKGGKRAGEEWQKMITDKAGVEVLVVETPTDYKDINDWIRETPGLDVDNLINNPVDPELKGVEIYDFIDMLNYKTEENPDCLLGQNWINKGGSALWVGQSGIGKSSLMAQACISWALDGMDLFGIKPKYRTLRSLIIQAENDECDMSAMMQGTMNVFFEGYSDQDRKDIAQICRSNIKTIRDTIHTGETCTKMLSKLIKKFKPDLVWLDPLMSYAGIDISDQKEATRFLRGMLNPIAFDTGVAFCLMHHTGKPSKEKAKSGWTQSDFSYAGLGSSELTNWARTVCVFNESAEEGIYDFMITKRGRQAQMKDLQGNQVSRIKIQHDTFPRIHWHQAGSSSKAGETEEEARKTAGRPSHFNEGQILEQIHYSEVRTIADIRKRVKEEYGMSQSSWNIHWKNLKNSGKIIYQDNGYRLKPISMS